MARVGGPKIKNSGRWTQARFDTFIKGALRSASRKWGPLNDCLKDARVRRGVYKCAGCEQQVPASTSVRGKRVKNAVVDHILPVIDPEVGFTSWDDYVDRLFCETENLQVLCHNCHEEKTNNEKAQAKNRREREKDDK